MTTEPPSATNRVATSLPIPRSSSGDDSNLILETHGRSIEALESDKPALCRQEMIPQQFVERFRAFLREEDSRSLQLHGWLCSGYRLGQPVRPLHREVDVIRTPDDKGRSL